MRIMIDTFLKSVWTQYGMAGLMAILLFFVLRWVMKREKEISDQAIARELSMTEIINGQRKALEDHTLHAKDYHNEHRTAHEFQRKEHGMMITDLKEITKALGRINGFKE